MTPRVIRQPRITREMVRANPDTLFAFGDNMQRRGLGGQAREMRGEPNAVGVPTKWAPGRAEGDYFSDASADYYDVRKAIDAAFKMMRWWVRSGRSVVIPADGLGTGLAELPTRAPRVHALIKARIAGLEALASPDADGAGRESALMTDVDDAVRAVAKALYPERPKPTVAELEAILSAENDEPVMIAPDGTVVQHGKDSALLKAEQFLANLRANGFAVVKLAAEGVSAIDIADRMLQQHLNQMKATSAAIDVVMALRHAGLINEKLLTDVSDDELAAEPAPDALPEVKVGQVWCFTTKHEHEIKGTGQFDVDLLAIRTIPESCVWFMPRSDFLAWARRTGARPQ